MINTKFIPPSRVNQLQRDGDHQPLSSQCFPAADVGAIAVEVVSTSKPAFRGELMVASSGWSQVLMIEDSWYDHGESMDEMLVTCATVATRQPLRSSCTLETEAVRVI